jgi:hypothetical protein
LRTSCCQIRAAVSASTTSCCCSSSSSSAAPASPQPCRAASAHCRNIRPTASCTLDASPNSRTLAFFSTARIGISSNTLTASSIRPLRHHQRSPWRSQGRRHRVPTSRAEAPLRTAGPCAGARRRLLRPCHIAPTHVRTARVLGPQGAAAHASESALRAIAYSRPPKTCTHCQLPRVIRACSRDPLGAAHVPVAPAPAPALQHTSSCIA